MGAGPALPSSVPGLTGQGQEFVRGGCLGGCALVVIQFCWELSADHVSGGVEPCSVVEKYSQVPSGDSHLG